MSEFKIHPAAAEFPMMDEARFAELVDDIKTNGQRLPIIFCNGEVIDGRNRLKACEALGIEPAVKHTEGDPWAYVWSLNGNRRDLVADQRYLIWRECSAKSETWRAEQKRITDEANAKRSAATMRQHETSNPRAGENYGEATTCGSTSYSDPKAKTSTAKAAASGTNRGAVERGDKLAKDRPDLAEKVRRGEVLPNIAYREMRAATQQEKVDELNARAVDNASGLYDVIVLDPPWPMKKINRDVRPNQVGFDYPTMDESEIKAIDMPCADDCHVWVWTTHKFLPMALRCIEYWNLKYVCTFVWHKPGGFQPIGLPQYNCEFALYCRKGSPIFADTKAFPVAFAAARGAHSEKPQEFYDTVARVTAGRRLDMFNRREIDGFDGWGHESERMES